MLGLRRLLAVSGHLGGCRAPAVSPASAASSHSAFFVRALQILAQPGPVRIHKLSAPDAGSCPRVLTPHPEKNLRLLVGIVFPSCG